jgi:hypothetical protein
MTTTIKIYSQNKLKISGHSPTTIHTYNIRDGVKNNGMAYSEFNTDDYNRTRTELEKEGYTAHPADSTEIASNNYTIFREAV